MGRFGVIFGGCLILFFVGFVWLVFILFFGIFDWLLIGFVLILKI